MKIIFTIFFFIGATTIPSWANVISLPNSVSYLEVMQSSMTIGWSAVPTNPSNARYTFEVSVDSFSSITDSVNTQSQAVLQLAVFGMSSNTTYYCRLKVSNADGSNPLISTLTARATLPKDPAPLFMASAFVSVATNSVVIGWDNNGNNSLYSSYQSQISTNDFTSIVNTSTDTGRSASFTSLAPNTTYFSRVKVLGHSGVNSAYVVLGSTSTLANVPSVSQSGSFLQISSTAITLQWDANSNSLNTQYLIQTATNSNFQGNVTSTTWISTTATTISNLTASTTYYFQAKARNFNYIETSYLSLSSTVTLSATDTTTPTAIITGKVTQANSQGLSGIVVEAVDPDTNKTVSQTLSESNGTGNYTLTGLTAAKQYKVKVTWTANNVTSFVAKSNIPAGTLGYNLTLEISYNLASVLGTLALHPSTIDALRAKEQHGYSRQSYSALAQSPVSALSTGEPFVEVSAQGKLVARAPVDNDGKYEIKNLLPSDYTIVGFNGLSYSDPKKITVSEGQQAVVTLDWELINPASAFAFPNPASDAVTLRFASSVTSAETQISIYDIVGNSVRNFTKNEIENSGAGVYRARWDTTNANGSRVVSGIYLFVINARNPATGKTERVVKKFAILR